MNSSSIKKLATANHPKNLIKIGRLQARASPGTSHPYRTASFSAFAGFELHRLACGNLNCSPSLGVAAGSLGRSLTENMPNPNKPAGLEVRYKLVAAESSFLKRLQQKDRPGPGVSGGNIDFRSAVGGLGRCARIFQRIIIFSLVAL
jgi:hypothetical protein